MPLPLRIRLCVNLANPDWVEEIRAALTGRPPRRASSDKSAVVVKIHRPYLGNPNHLAIELRPRFGELRYWRIGFPAADPRPIAWGFGPANGGGISAVRSSSIEGTGLEIAGIRMDFVGAGDALSPSTSAYVVFVGQAPDRLLFGTSGEPFGTAMSGIVISMS